MTTAQIKARADFILNELTHLTERIHELANTADRTIGNCPLLLTLDTLASELQDASHKAHKELQAQ